MNEGKNNSPEATLLRQKAEEEIKGRHLNMDFHGKISCVIL